MRVRIMAAMVEVVYERGYAATTVTDVCARAGVSRAVFYGVFANRQECFLAIIDDGLQQSRELISEAFQRESSWVDGVREALVALLSYFDARRRLARVWLVETLGAGTWALERREKNLAVLTEMIVERWRPPPGAQKHPLAAETVMTAVLGALQNHLVTGRPEPLLSLLGPLMGVASAPYLDAATVGIEVQRGQEVAQKLLAAGSRAAWEPDSGLVEVPVALRDPRAHRLRHALVYLAVNAGASNRQVAVAIGIASQTQISTLLARLAQMGLVHKQPGRPGHPNAWELTSSGRQVSDAISAERPRHI